MKTTAKLFLILGIFYVPLIFIYGHFSNWDEPVGTVGLALSAGFGFMLAGYLAITEKKFEVSPSDRAEGEIADLAGDYGFFSPNSWAPLGLAAALSLIALGLAVGWWMVFVGAPLLIIAVMYWVFEYFGGEHPI